MSYRDTVFEFFVLTSHVGEARRPVFAWPMNARAAGVDPFPAFYVEHARTHQVVTPPCPVRAQACLVRGLDVCSRPDFLVRLADVTEQGRPSGLLVVAEEARFHVGA